MAEYAVNTHVSETTKASPFLANCGFHPRLGVEPRSTVTTATATQALPETQKADKFAECMTEIHEMLKEEMSFAQERYHLQADRSRAPSPRYAKGDLVWLNARNLKTTRPSKKSDAKNLGPFEVLEMVNPRAYRLRLDESMKIHNVFHTSLLQPATTQTPPPGQVQPPPQPVVIEREETAEEEWEVEAVWNSRLFGKRHHLQYLLKWKGYSKESWHSWKELLPGSDELIWEFHQKYPKKPGPPKGYDLEAWRQGTDEAGLINGDGQR